MSQQNPQSIQNEAYEHIKRKIMMCEYAPNQLLSEAVLLQEIGCSRTPVREAIRRLEQEGLATVLPKRGTIVSGFSVGDVNDIFEIRMLVEPYAIQTYGEQLDPAELQRYLELFRHPDSQKAQIDFYELDDEFHKYLHSAMTNKYLRDLYARIHTQNVRLRVMSGQLINQRLARTMEEHAEIAEACLSRDWTEASEKMRRHLECSRSSYFEAIVKNKSETNLM